MQRLVICGLCLLGFAYPAVLPLEAAIVTNGTFDTPDAFSDDDSGSNGDGWLTSTTPGVSGGAVNSILNEQGFLRTGTSSQETGHVAAGALETFFSLEGDTLETSKNGQEGSGIAQSITVGDGDMLSFDWNFLTNENSREPGSSEPDFAFWSLVPEGTTSDEVNVLAIPSDADESASGTDFDDQTGFESVSNYVLTSGTYLLGFGVVDVEDKDVNSALLIDNVQVTAAPTAVPEPGSLALLGLGTVGLAWRRRRRKQAKQVALPTTGA